MSLADYRRALAEDALPLTAPSHFDSATVSCVEPSQILGTAMHWASHVRPEVAKHFEISDEDRHYEEDPETHRFLRTLTHTILPHQSRYEMDLNRPPDVAIYSRPELAWGVNVFKEPLPQHEREVTLEKWYEFHNLIDAAVEDAIRRFGRVFVLDLHSYNYQRGGPTDWRTDGKPVINLGTRHLQLDDEGRSHVDWFMDELRAHTVLGEACLVQENGVFLGGYLNRRLSRTYGPRCITLSVEYKKVYMEESTGELHDDVLEDLVDQLDHTLGRLAGRLGAPVRKEPEVPTTAQA